MISFLISDLWINSNAILFFINKKKPLCVFGLCLSEGVAHWRLDTETQQVNLPQSCMEESSHTNSCGADGECDGCNCCPVCFKLRWPRLHYKDTCTSGLSKTWFHKSHLERESNDVGSLVFALDTHYKEDCGFSMN